MLASFLASQVVLQWSHGVAAVETGRRGRDEHRTVGASMEPRRRRRGNTPTRSRIASLRLLQWSHGVAAVETRERCSTRTPFVSSFNGATASPPWKHAASTRLWRPSARFNGATASPPWKPPSSRAFSTDSGTLQWSHGVAAVETDHPRHAMHELHDASMEPRRRRRGNLRPFDLDLREHESASMEPRRRRRGNLRGLAGLPRGMLASMEPRRRRRGNGPSAAGPAGRRTGFNGATASPPWKQSRASRGTTRSWPLQWSHGVAAVETHSFVAAPAAGRCASMEPRRRRRGNRESPP